MVLKHKIDLLLEATGIKVIEVSQRYRIDVNGFRVRQCKEGEEKPCIRLTEGKNITYHDHIEIQGPSYIIQSKFDPDNPNQPFIWIETDGPIKLSPKDNT